MHSSSSDGSSLHFTQVLGESLTESVWDVLELGVDSVLTDGVVRELPVVKTVAELYKAGVRVREGLFARKLVDFLRATRRTAGPTPGERHVALRDLGGEERQRRLGEAMVLLLERADDLRKPILYGRIVGALVKGDVSYSVAMTACAVLDRVVLDDLDVLESAAEESVVPWDAPALTISVDDSRDGDLSAVHRLQALGLVVQTVHDAGGPDRRAVQRFSVLGPGKLLRRLWNETS